MLQGSKVWPKYFFMTEPPSSLPSENPGIFGLNTFQDICLGSEANVKAYEISGYK